MIEETGYDSCVCAYEATNLKDYVRFSRKELEEELSVEFRKSFILRYGKEC